MSLANGILKIDELRKHIVFQQKSLNIYINKSIQGDKKYEDEIMDLTVTIVALLRAITNIENEMKDIFVDGLDDKIKRLMN